MKKKISLLGLVLILVFSLAGCGSSSETSYDQETLESYVDAIVSAFSSQTDEELDAFSDLSDFELDYLLMQSGLPIESDDFLTMIDAWEAAEEECGTILSIGEYTMETDNDGATLIADIEGELKTGEIEFGFSEDGYLESLTVNADYGIGEILRKAGLNTILGMGTVFVVLIFISFIISLFKYIPALEAKFSKKEKAAPAEQTAPKPAPVVIPVEEEAAADDGELVAVIAAAIAASEGTSTDGFVVRSIKRRKSNKWS